MPADAQLPSLIHVLMDEDTESGQRATGSFKEDNLRQRTGATKLTKLMRNPLMASGYWGLKFPSQDQKHQGTVQLRKGTCPNLGRG